MYALYDNVAGCVDLFFTDDDIINDTPVGCYVKKSLTTMRDNFDIYTDSDVLYYQMIKGKPVIRHLTLFGEEQNNDADKINNAKHVKVE